MGVPGSSESAYTIDEGPWTRPIADGVDEKLQNPNTPGLHSRVSLVRLDMPLTPLTDPAVQLMKGASFIDAVASVHPMRERSQPKHP